MLCAAPAWGQDTSETTSSGERFESEDTYEIGTGSTIFTVNFRAQVGTEEIDVGSMSRYFKYFTADEISQTSPPNYDYYIGAAIVSITGWSAPQLSDSQYEIIDIFSEDTPYYDVRSVVTTQRTSGDGPDAVVPFGWRGNCYSDGSNGDTNFGAFDGQLADCEYSEGELYVPAGTINTNTHTTIVYRSGTHHFQSVDDGYTDTYLFVPTATATMSWGTLATTSSSLTTVRNDAYQVELTGTFAGETIFAQAVAGQFGDAAVQSNIALLSRPRGHSINGAPAVLVWSDPVRTGIAEELVSSTNESETETTTGILETVTTTDGSAPGAGVYIGDRGACTDAGLSGAANGISPTGAAAACEGGVFYAPGPGVTNTNRHAMEVTNTHTATTTTETWLTTESWQLAATAVAVGQIHSAVRDVLFNAGVGFARRHATALESRNGLGLGLWAEVFAGKTERNADPAGPASTHSAHGLAGGVSFRLSGIASLGIAASHETVDSDLVGLSERADLSHAQLGLAAELSPGVWRLAVTAGRGWGEVDTERGAEAIGGVARASYDARTWFASVEAGPEFGLGLVTLRPLAGFEWSRATLGEFAESGGIALAGREDSASRLAATLGAQAATRWNLPAGPSIRLWADARAGQVIDGDERDRAAVFASDPGSVLQVTSASEGDSYAAGRAGVSLFVAGGLGLHLGAEGRTGGGASDWRANGGVSAAF